MPATATAALKPGSFHACASCQAPTEFDPKTGGLKCPYCGSEKPIAQGPVAYHGVSEMAALSQPPDDRVRTMKCTHCGAQSNVSGNVASTRCPFCAAPLGQGKAETAPPAEGVIPFALEKDAAGIRFSDWLKRLWFRPSNLKRMARLGAVRGIYVPNWAFDAHAESSWTAEAGYYYDVVETVVVNGKQEKRTRRETRWEPARGHHEAMYRNVLISASAGLSASELSALEPFELGRLTRFEGEFLAGFEAETHALAVLDGWRKAEQRIHSEEHSACDRQVPGDTHRSLRVSTDTSRETVRSLLVPVYIAAYEYAGKLYRVVINGQTGKVTGQAPWSPWKIAGFVLLLSAIGAGIYFYVSQQQ